MEFKEHSFMVKSLLKPGADILATLTPEKVNMLHCAIGLSGEVAELFDADVDDRENIVEELGDIDFYLDGLYQSVDAERQENTPSTINDETASEALFYLVIGAGDILDTVKKHVVYNKDIDFNDLYSKIYLFDCALTFLRGQLGITKQECIDGNAAKLAVRYKGGYSDQAAQDRADKQ